jgi:hypothetical protein
MTADECRDRRLNVVAPELNRLLKNSGYIPYTAFEEAVLVQHLVARKSFSTAC